MFFSVVGCTHPPSVACPIQWGSGETNVRNEAGRRGGDKSAARLPTIRQPQNAEPWLGVRPAGVAGQRGLQEGHLVREDAAIAEDETLAAAYRVRHVQQRHVRFFWPAVALARIAGAAGGDDVGPLVAAAARYRQDVFDGQFAFGEVVSAIR